MAGPAELFTVCSSCGQQVSSFVTECPYCGTRLRQRAPRLDRKDGDLEALLRMPAQEPDRTLLPEDDNVVPLKRRRRRPLAARALKTKPLKIPRSMGRRPASGSRPSRLAALRGSSTPWVTIAVVVLSILALPLQQVLALSDLVVYDGAPFWRPLTGALVYGGTWQALAVLTTFGVFGWLWERRAGLVGSLAVLVAFVVAGAGGLVVDQQLGSAGIAYGGAGAAIALATAWIVAEVRARQRRESLDGDLIGATVLLLVPVATTALTPAAAPSSIAVGLVVGGVLGVGLAAARR